MKIFHRVEDRCWSPVHQQFGAGSRRLDDGAARREVPAQHSDAGVFLQGLLARGDDVGVPDWVPIDSFDEGAAGHGDRSRVEQIGDLGKDRERPAPRNRSSIRYLPAGCRLTSSGTPSRSGRSLQG